MSLSLTRFCGIPLDYLEPITAHHLEESGRIYFDKDNGSETSLCGLYQAVISATSFIFHRLNECSTALVQSLRERRICLLFQDLREIALHGVLAVAISISLIVSWFIPVSFSFFTQFDPRESERGECFSTYKVDDPSDKSVEEATKAVQPYITAYPSQEANLKMERGFFHTSQICEEYIASFPEECENIISDFYINPFLSHALDKKKIAELLRWDLLRSKKILFFINGKEVNSPTVEDLLKEISEKTYMSDENVYRSLCLLQQGSRAKTYAFSKGNFERIDENIDVMMKQGEDSKHYRTIMLLDLSQNLVQYTAVEYFSLYDTSCYKEEAVLRHTTTLSFNGERSSYESCVQRLGSEW